MVLRQDTRKVPDLKMTGNILCKINSKRPQEVRSTEEEKKVVKTVTNKGDEKKDAKKEDEKKEKKEKAR